MLVVKVLSAYDREHGTFLSPLLAGLYSMFITKDVFLALHEASPASKLIYAGLIDEFTGMIEARLAPSAQ